MKQSHLTAPRTLAECEFTTGYGLVEYPHEASHRAVDLLVAVVAVALIAAAVLGVL